MITKNRFYLILPSQQLPAALHRSFAVHLQIVKPEDSAQSLNSLTITGPAHDVSIFC